MEFRQASHPTFWVCEEKCKSGCGAALSSYSHCCRHDDGNGENGANGTDANGTDANGTDANGTGTNGTGANGTDANGTDANGTSTSKFR